MSPTGRPEGEFAPNRVSAEGSPVSARVLVARAVFDEVIERLAVFGRADANRRQAE